MRRAKPWLVLALLVSGCADSPASDAQAGGDTLSGATDAGVFNAAGAGGSPPGIGPGGGASGDPDASDATPAGGSDTPADPNEPDAEPGPTAAECEPLSPCGLACVDLQADPENCGQCGRTCVLPDGEAACVAGECALAACDTGFFDRDGDQENGCETESDCVQGGACATACDTEGQSDCSGPVPVCTPPIEACNALDDDCNGGCDDGAPAGCRVPVHRGVGDGHLYTTDLGAVQAAPFHLETAGFFHLYTQSAQGMRPVFLCRKGDGKRFLTSDQACEIGVGPERTLGFWSPAPLCGSIPLYRLYSPGSGDHFFTTSAPERDNAVAQYGYRDEGVAGHVWPAP